MMDINTPERWKARLKMPGPQSHKYTRGHTLVIGGGIYSTGAAKLSAIAALRAGSGLVSIACDAASVPVYATTLLSVMTKPLIHENDLEHLLGDERISAVLIGPGNGVSQATRERTLRILAHKKPCVIDADALSAFAAQPHILFKAITSHALLTPHEGEFSRLFPSLSGSAELRASAAAAQSNAVVVLKGHHTVIAAPDGRVCVNQNAPAWLATAGSGDVLAGIITGLLAQGMDAYDAACAATWMHGRAAALFGPGLIAEDIPGMLPAVWRELVA